MTDKQPTSPKDFLRVSRVFAAPRSKVFRAWTEPDILKRWWGPKGSTTPVIEMDLQVGGQYRFGMKYPDRDIFYVKGVYREVQVPEKLVFTWRWESPDMDFGDSLVTIEFHEQNGGTEVTLRHEGFPNGEVCLNHETGWLTFFDNFAVVEDM